MIGEANEVIVNVGGVEVQALLDTGSMVSTISEALVSQLGLQAEPVEALLRVQCAGGSSLPYSGCVQVSLVVKNFSCHVLFLVVPETDYNLRVPVLLGTNVLSLLFSSLGGEKLSAGAWVMARECLQLHQQVMVTDGLGKVVTGTREVKVPANSKIFVQGSIQMSGPLCQRVCVAAEEVEGGSPPGGVVVSPSVQFLQAGVRRQRVVVQVANLSQREVVIPPGYYLCELNAVTVVSAADESEEGSWKRPSLPEGLSVSEVERVEAVLAQFGSVFSQHDLDLGRTNMLKHHIRLTDDLPFKQRHRRVPPHLVEEVKRHLAEMLELGVIRESESPFASPVVLVRKKDGSLRFCIDLRKLNSRTIRDAYSLPRIEETLDTLHGASWFSVLDLKSGYWQVELEEGDKAKTAFSVGSLGFFECNRMPFGLTNAPATLQRMMETVLASLQPSQCLVYIDDVIVFNHSFEEHVTRLSGVLAKGWIEVEAVKV
ncbi:MAG: reverse transcriptase family protein [Kangiellaceae bacterium]|nr:reverse transcriptase family protein [Kangiellaceae bacterium]